jgi:hypothetical protein
MVSRPERDLEGALRDLGAHVAMPPPPALAARVSARLREEPRPAPALGVGVRLRQPRRALGLVAAAALVLFGALVTFSPAVRTAVADWLGIPGVRIRVRQGAPPPSLATELELGRRTALSQARAEVEFDIARPRGAGIGAPDAVYLGRLPATVVTLMWRADDRLPRAHETGVGVLLTQFEASLRQDLIAKTAFEGATVEPVAVDGARGYWIAGPPHVVLYLMPNGEVIEDSARLAANTLLWQRDAITLRLESALTKNQALRIARATG